MKCLKRTVTEFGEPVVQVVRVKDGRAAEMVKTGGFINATQIAVDEIGRDIPNTALLGALAATTGWLKLDSLIACLKDYLSGEILERNYKSAERGYHEVEVIKW